MEGLFDVVYQFLKWLSNVSGLSYREINVLVYFYLTPLFFIYLIERITKRDYLKAGFLAIATISLIIIPDFQEFSNKVFDASVVFLKWFHVVGLNYVQASVVVCVLIPIITITMLLYFGSEKVFLK